MLTAIEAIAMVEQPGNGYPEDIQMVIKMIDYECALAKIEMPEKHWDWAKFYAECLDLNSNIKVRDDATYPPVKTWLELVQKRKFSHENQ